MTKTCGVIDCDKPAIRRWLCRIEVDEIKDGRIQKGTITDYVSVCEEHNKAFVALHSNNLQRGGQFVN